MPHTQAWMLALPQPGEEWARQQSPPAPPLPPAPVVTPPSGQAAQSYVNAFSTQLAFQDRAQQVASIWQTHCSTLFSLQPGVEEAVQQSP